MANVLSNNERELIDAYWRAANYLSVGQIYLYDNPLLKQTLTNLLREAGTTGLNATTAVEVAERRGVHLEKQSVSSTLSRMKAEGLVS